MCGIGGWFGRHEAFDAKSLIAALRHRGPDGEGLWRDPGGRAALLHTRLAILDLSETGAQPMGWEEFRNSNCEFGNDKQNARFQIVFNGEIYNFHELKAQLISAGESFEGTSDTEVLLRLLAREGKAALPKLAGMFAFAFYDRESGHALLARDAFGIKPLYYTEKEGCLLFASEAHALRDQVAATQPNGTALRDTLLWGTVPEPATLSDGIEQLPAGCFVEWDGAVAKLGRWHNLRFGAAPAPIDPVATTRTALIESVRRHLVSDVPVGIFLSGGIDSTAVLALARQVLGPSADLRTFSIGFDDPSYDESTSARRTAELFGASHTEWHMTSQEGHAEIAGYLAAMDQPTNDGFNTWCVSKLARSNGVKVVLSGLGGDELFAGYNSFRLVPKLLRMHRAFNLLRPAVAALFNLASVGSRWHRVGAYLRGPGTPLAAFHVLRGFFNEAEARELVLSLTGQDPGPVDWRCDDLPDGDLDSVSFLELTRYMRNQLLRDSDVFSMAHGLELRVPFVDSRLFETISSIPASIRLRFGKQLLLDAVPEIPEWVRNQPKRGFRFPFQEWMRGEFGDVLSAADKRTTVPLGAWYRRWTLAAVLLKAFNNPVEPQLSANLSS